MVHERREPTLSSTASPTADKRTARPASSSPTSRPSPSPRPQVIVQKQSSSVIWLMFLLVILSLAGTGYMYWQQTQTQQIVSAQQIRIADLEGKLALSDDESTQSLTALTANIRSLDKDFKLAMSEIDKLWATRNVNKKAAEDNESKINASVSKINSSIAAIEQKLKPLSSLQQKATEQELLIQSLRERQSTQSTSIKALEASTKDIASMSQKVNSVSQKVQSYDEVIESMDKFRLSTNRDLLLLKQRAGVAPAQ